jgi:hypothetical protein
LTFARNCYQIYLEHLSNPSDGMSFCALSEFLSDISAGLGGTRTYSGLDASALLNATQNFIQNNNDPKAAVIVTGSFAIENLAELFVLFFFYDGPTPPAGIFDEFDAVIPIEDQVSTQSYYDIVC